jgi:hypothetical protein
VVWNRQQQCSFIVAAIIIETRAYFENSKQNLIDLSIATNIEFLDGYRGFLAILVFMSHLLWAYVVTIAGDSSYVEIQMTGVRNAVPGFFVLSSFLISQLPAACRL